MGSRVRHWWLLLVVVAALGWTACGDDDGDRVVTDTDLRGSCVACHLDQVALQALAVEEEVPEDTGEG